MTKLILTIALLTGSYVAGASSPLACAQTPQGVASQPELKSLVRDFGGASSLFTTWRLAGFAGLIMKVRVTLKATENGFTVRVNEDDTNEFWFCVDSNQPNVLRMQVQNPYDSENSLFLLKPNEPGRSVLVASQKSKWKFMKFKRVDDNDD